MGCNRRRRQVGILKYYLPHILLIDKTGDRDLSKHLSAHFILEVFIFAIIAGCIAIEPVNQLEDPLPQIPESVPTGNVPVISQPETTTNASVQPTVNIQEQSKKAQPDENYSEAAEVDYREYVDWFLLNNNNIRYYTPDEYVCGQYTVDMLNASKKAGFNAYFGAVRFSDKTGHALVAFKSTFSGYTSWYFFEPQTNKQMTPETIKGILQERMGAIVTEVTVYGYYDDAGDKDPATWRFAYPLYNQKY